MCDTVGPNVVNGLAHSHSYSLLFAISSEQGKENILMKFYYIYNFDVFLL